MFSWFYYYCDVFTFYSIVYYFFLYITINKKNIKFTLVIYNKTISNKSHDNLKKFKQITIEVYFNYLPINYFNIDQKLQILRKLADMHYLVHVHLNNFSKIINNNGFILPASIEFTYIRKDLQNYVGLNDDTFLLNMILLIIQMVLILFLMVISLLHIIFDYHFSLLYISHSQNVVFVCK